METTTDNTNENEQLPVTLKVGDTVEFISENEDFLTSLKKTYIYSSNPKHQYQFIIPHTQGMIFDTAFEEKLIKEGYDVSKLEKYRKDTIIFNTAAREAGSKEKVMAKFVAVKASELKLLSALPVKVVAPVEMITFTFPKEKWIGVVSLMEGQAQMFINNKTLLMFQPGMTEEMFVEMQDIVDSFLVEAKKGY